MQDQFFAFPYYYPLYDNKDYNSYKAGDEITLEVKVDWYGQKAGRDYSVVVYSKQDIYITNEEGYHNQLHFDRSSPSGFRN